MLTHNLISRIFEPARQQAAVNVGLKAILAVAVFLVMSISASGQLSTATASGTVADLGGAVIPNATIVFTQT
jgi:hypothetical protein